MTGASEHVSVAIEEAAAEIRQISVAIPRASLSSGESALLASEAFAPIQELSASIA